MRHLVSQKSFGSSSSILAPLPIGGVPQNAIASRNSSNSLSRSSSIATSVPPPSRSALRRVAKKLNVLIVDDSISIMKIMKMSLERAGHKVSQAVNGKIALELMKQSQFDVVLMDLQMPVMGGIESVTLFRKYESMYLLNKTRASRQLIVGMSANGEALVRQQALEAEMDEFVSKPFSLDSLMATLTDSDPDPFF